MSHALTMPFGKYKGTAFTELDTDYLEWAAQKPDFFREEKYKTALLAELERRQAGGKQTAPRPPQHQSKPTSGIPRERIVMGIELIKRQCNQTAVHDALDSLLRMLDSVEQPSQARPAPTDGAPKKTYVDYPDPPEDEEESGTEDIPF